MIAKNIKGKSFKGCVSYVMNDTATLLEAEGVWAETTQDIIRSFAMQRLGRKEIKQPVGHIPIAFSPEDSHRLTNDFMLQLAKEYMQEMGIVDTQYIIVRHDNTEHPHLHIVYNRIDNDLKLISVNNDYKRNIKVCKKLKDKYGLTYGEGKEKVKREKLNDPDKVKYLIYDAIKAGLPHCKDENDLKSLLEKSGIETEFKLRRTTSEVEGISFRYNNIAFKGSEVDRKFSYANFKKEFEKNRESKKEQVQESATNESAIDIDGLKLSSEQMQILREDGYVYLENMQQKDGSKVSAYIFFDDQMKQPFYTQQNPESSVKYGKYGMRLMDKLRIEAGFVTKAKVNWYGGGFAYPYLWKANKSDTDYQEAWSDPRVPKTDKKEEKQDLPTKLKKNRGRRM